MAICRQSVSSTHSRSFFISGISVLKERISTSGSVSRSPFARQATITSRCISKPIAHVKTSCILPSPNHSCRLGIARVDFRTLLLVLFTCMMPHSAVLLGNPSTLNKRGNFPPRFDRTSLLTLLYHILFLFALVSLFSSSTVMAFHEALTTS